MTFIFTCDCDCGCSKEADIEDAQCNDCDEGIHWNALHRRYEDYDKME